MAFYRRETSSFQINSNLNQISIRTFSIYENSSVDQIRMSVNIQQRSSLVLTNRSQERETFKTTRNDLDTNKIQTNQNDETDWRLEQ